MLIITASELTASGKNKSGLVKVAAVPEFSRLGLEDTVMLAFRFKIQKGWHIYWLNPGDAGLPTEIELELPENWKQGPTLWPPPKKFTESELTSFAYDKSLVLFVPIYRDTKTPVMERGIATDSLEFPQKLHIKAKVKWLVCKEECFPGDTNLKISLNFGKTAPNTDFDKLNGEFDKTRIPELPTKLAGNEIKGNAMKLWLRGSADLLIEDIYPYQPGYFNYSSGINFSREGEFSLIGLLLDPFREKNPDRIDAIVRVRESDKIKYYRISFKF